MSNSQSTPLENKSNDDQCELQSLGELERQYVEHSVMRETKLDMLQKRIAENDVIINALRADITDTQMKLEKRTDAYTALIPQRGPIIQMLEQGQIILNTAVNEQETLKTELSNVEIILSNYSAWDETKATIPNDSFIEKTKELKKHVECAIKNLKELKKEKEFSKMMKKICEDKENDLKASINILNKSIDEKNKMSNENFNLPALSEKHNQLVSQIEYQDGIIQEMSIQEKNIKERVTEKQNSISEMREKINKVREELTLRDEYEKQLDEKIEKLMQVNKQLKEDIEETNIKWINNDEKNEEALRDVEEQFGNEQARLNEIRKATAVLKKEYADAKLIISQEAEMEKEHVCRVTDLTCKIKQLISKKETMALMVNSIKEEKNKLEKQAEDVQNALKTSKSRLEEIEKKRNLMNLELKELIDKKENLVKMKNDLKPNEITDETKKLTNLKNALSEEVGKIKQEIESLDLNLDETELESLKLPVIGDKLIQDFAEGIEKWRQDVKFETEQKTAQKEEIRLKFENCLNEAHKSIEKIRNDVSAVEQQISAQKHTAEILDKKHKELQQERETIISELKMKQDELAEEKKQNTLTSRDLFQNAENVEPNRFKGRRLKKQN